AFGGIAHGAGAGTGGTIAAITGRAAFAAERTTFAIASGACRTIAIAGEARAVTRGAFTITGRAAFAAE
ncbi:hypothetical protein, partial [Burkholderia gladioli]|uniref:hypothetical protein n=1 Tax=Burkholderia gladioli TaxID=28095 RepID=UPI00163FB9BA